jgi:predicted DNA-binding transcriptional regulator YafY
LSPHIARFGVSQRFDEMEFEHHADGSVTVTAKTGDIFTAARTLLHYGGNCQVLGGSELLEEIQKLVSDLSSLYLQNTP